MSKLGDTIDKQKLDQLIWDGKWFKMTKPSYLHEQWQHRKLPRRRLTSNHAYQIVDSSRIRRNEQISTNKTEKLRVNCEIEKERDIDWGFCFLVLIREKSEIQQRWKRRDEYRPHGNAKWEKNPPHKTLQIACFKIFLSITAEYHPYFKWISLFFFVNPNFWFIIESIFVYTMHIAQYLPF